MATDKRADFFDGKVEQNEYTQIADLEYAAGVRSLVTQKSVEQSFTFTGLTYEDAHRTTDVTVTDIDGNEYVVPWSGSIRDGSSGTKSFVTEEVRISRRRISYHMWEVTVRRVGSEYYVNNAVLIHGPAWAFDGGY